MGKNLALGIDAFLGVGVALQDNPTSNIDLGHDNPEGFYLGGMDTHWRDNVLPLVGFRQTEIRANQVGKLGLTLQYSPIKKLFIIPTVQAAVIESGFKDFYKSVFSIETQGFIGYGVTAAYRSPIGPISFTFSKNTSYERPYWYFTLGFK